MEPGGASPQDGSRYGESNAAWAELWVVESEGFRKYLRSAGLPHQDIEDIIGACYVNLAVHLASADDPGAYMRKTLRNALADYWKDKHARPISLDYLQACGVEVIASDAGVEEQMIDRSAGKARLRVLEETEKLGDWLTRRQSGEHILDPDDWMILRCYVHDGEMPVRRWIARAAADIGLSEERIRLGLYRATTTLKQALTELSRNNRQLRADLELLETI